MKRRPKVELFCDDALVLRARFPRLALLLETVGTPAESFDFADESPLPTASASSLRKKRNEDNVTMKKRALVKRGYRLRKE